MVVILPPTLVSGIIEPLQGARWAYLAVVIDLFSRKPVGWAMSLSPNTELVKKALTIAYESRGEPSEVIDRLLQLAATT
ncbi:MAG: DDE-type integrase/transposase/recombinase [Alteromonadaceae bacterium]|nr:DDE-type integrase/transposase/recombinase [Alteromonadaceae bacterium]